MFGALNLALNQDTFLDPEETLILNYDNTMRKGLHGVQAHLLLKLDLHRQAQTRHKMQEMWNLVANL